MAAPIVARLAATSFVIALLAALSALGCFATSVYLPSMPVLGVALAGAARFLALARRVDFR